MGPFPSWPSKLAVAGTFGAILVLSAGCGIVTAINAGIPVKGALLHDGFLDVKVSHSPELPHSGQAVTVKVVTSGTKSDSLGNGPAGDPVTEAAKDVWLNFPYTFDKVSIKIAGSDTLTMTSSQLASEFGPRPATVSDQSISRLVSTGWDEIYAIVGVVVLLLLAGVARFPRTSEKLT